MYKNTWLRLQRLVNRKVEFDLNTNELFLQLNFLPTYLNSKLLVGEVIINCSGRVIISKRQAANGVGG
jgi:hypothetical protein